MATWIRSLSVLFLFAAVVAASEPNVTDSNAVRLKQSLDALRTTGSVLIIAAHPDDENNALIGYLARGRHIRTAYLSLTRGEGGQNVIGPEEGSDLGVLRTQELLRARGVDGGVQFFTRAIDFGFTKNPEETMQKWGHDAVLGDIVWVIRKFRPDVVILQFSGTPRDGHGQHQASEILGREAYAISGDPTRFPEQLKYIRPWHAQRLMMNPRGFSREMQKDIAAMPDRVDLPVGDYNPLLGYSYGELGGIARSYNSSQSDGTPRRRGAETATLITVAGPVAKHDLFDGIDTSWRRFPNGAAVQAALDAAASQWNPERPYDLIPELWRARELASKIDDPAAQRQVHEIDEAIARCAGLWLDLSTIAQQIVSNQPATLRLTAIARTHPPVTLLSLKVDGAEFKRPTPHILLTEDEPLALEEPITVDAGTTYTQPYWLLDPPRGDLYTVRDPRLLGLPRNPAPLMLTAELTIGPATVILERPVVYRYIDRLDGESIEPVAEVPPASLRILEPTLVFPNNAAKPVDVEVTAETENIHGAAELHAPAGWTVSPASRDFQLPHEGASQVLRFDVSPGPRAASGDLTGDLLVGGETIRVGIKKIAYPHIPLQTLFPPATAQLVRTDAVTLAKRVGYVMGSGDDVPEALRQLGCNVVMLTANDLAEGDLSRYDAIVTGIRAYTERPDLAANQQRLLAYVANGGTLVVQYNRIERGSAEIMAHLGPWPFTVSHDRVTVEEAPVVFDSKNVLLDSPNKITSADFDGWVQERGLYFPSTWDPRYETPFETHDPGEAPLHGATLVARYGRGVFIYTAFSWFRELPAGVPGAYRIFANFLSAAKTLDAHASNGTR